jgi:flagellar hook-length control protein FliK
VEGGELVTAMNMPVIPGAVAKKPTTPIGEKRLLRESSSKGSNSSFYKQLKQINQKQKALSENKTSEAMDRTSPTGPKPDEQQVQAEDKSTGKNHIRVINQTGEKSDGVSATNPEKTVNNLIEFTEMDSADEVIVPSVLVATLPEQVEAENHAENELLVSEVPVLNQEEAGIAVSGADEFHSQPEDTKTIASDPQNGQQLTTDSNSNSSSTATGEEQINPVATTFIAPEQTDRTEITSISSNNLDQSLTDKTIAAPMPAGEEVKPEVNSGQMTPAVEKVAKEAPEIKPLAKESLPPQSGNQKAQSESGAETKQDTNRDFIATSKNSPTTDVKKLINFETHRLNASRLNSEPAPIPESQAKAIVDDGKAVLNTLSRSDTDLFRATTIADSSKNLPTAREIMAQVVQKAELLFSNKLSELRIDLKPEFLGRLTIKVMVEEGVVTARFIAESQQVKQMLETNLNMLRQNLESQGLRVDRTEVSVQLNNGGLFDGSESSRQYLWEEGQFAEGRQRDGPYEGKQYTGGYEEMDPAVTQGVADYGYNENGSLNFLI